MKNKQLSVLGACAILLALSAFSWASVVPLNDALKRAADWLVAEQDTDGDWVPPDEQGFIGEPTVGLIAAFGIIGDAAYKTAAETAAEKILLDAGYGTPAAPNPFDAPTFGTEAYALARLGEISTSRDWTGIAKELFDQITLGGNTYANTAEFADGIIADAISSPHTDLSEAVYSLARFAVASDLSGGADTSVWVDKLKSNFASVTSTENYQTHALALTVWALGTIGPYPTDTVGGTGPFMNNTFAELPTELVNLQSVDGGFAALFDGTFPGETEPTALGVLGLKAARGQNSAAYPFDNQIGIGELALAAAVGTGNESGYVFEMLDGTGGGPQAFLAGNVAEAIPLPASVWMGLSLLAVLGAAKTIRVGRKPLEEKCAALD